MEVVIGLCRHNSAWDRYLIRVKKLAKLNTTYRTAVTLSTRSKTLRSHQARSWSPMTCQHFLPVSLCLTQSLPLNANWTAIHYYTNAPPLPQTHNWTAVLLPERHVLLVQRQHLQTKTWSGHTQTSIWTLTLTTISNTRGLLYEHSLIKQTAWSSNRSRKMLRSDMSSPHSKPMAPRSGPLRSPTQK